MKINLTSEEENPLLKRKEINFKVIHEETGSTPPRSEVREAIADTLKVTADLVFLKKLETKTGTHIAEGLANVYESENQVKLVEPEYIIERNIPSRKTTEEE